MTSSPTFVAWSAMRSRCRPTRPAGSLDVDGVRQKAQVDEDVLELANVGFASAPCNAKQDLSKGWLHNTLYLDNIFSVYNVFIGGDGVYLDTTTGTEKTNAICLDDNLYFYVNGELKYRGGTVGAVVGNINTYEAGDEVMKCTGGCTGVPQRWCIPALNCQQTALTSGKITA